MKIFCFFLVGLCVFAAVTATSDYSASESDEDVGSMNEASSDDEIAGFEDDQDREEDMGQKCFKVEKCFSVCRKPQQVNPEWMEKRSKIPSSYWGPKTPGDKYEFTYKTCFMSVFMSYGGMMGFRDNGIGCSNQRIIDHKAGSTYMSYFWTSANADTDFKIETKMIGSKSKDCKGLFTPILTVGPNDSKDVDIQLCKKDKGECTGSKVKIISDLRRIYG